MPATYDIIPGKSVGPFLLGDSLWRILDLLRTEKRSYPKIDLAWDTSSAAKSDITISLPNVTLYFPHPAQRLSLIKIHSIPTSSLTLSYEGKVLHSPTQSLTRGVAGRILGPTYSGDGRALSYPGIKFGLAPSEQGGRDDKVDHVTVVPKDEGGLPPIEPLIKVEVQPGRGVIVHIPHRVEVLVGQTTAQDILLDLGSPLRKFVKEDERMERIWGEESSEAASSTFWNYFQYGIDFLITQSGVISKIVLHSNIPGTPLFQTHARCPWILPTSSGTLDHTSSVASFRAHLTGSPPPPPVEEHLTVPVPTTANGTGKKKKSRTASPAISEPGSNGAVSPSTVDEGQGMVLDRVVEGGLDGVEGMSPSHLIGFNGLILEEDRASGGITSVLIYQQERQGV